MEKKSELTQQEMKSLIIKIIVRFSLLPIFLGLLTLLPAGTFNYWQVYVYFVVLVVPMLFVLLYFLQRDPKFLVRRMRAKEKEEQQILISIFSAFIFLAGFI
ncbi:MAG: hypothetical protein KAQ62_24630, partial [Cyclobacteriaceae bacterium]|nr:hypothetical protein [Cyclobacteriaceae bacterium]